MRVLRALGRFSSGIKIRYSLLLLLLLLIETGYDWSVNYELKYVDALTKYAAEFYERQQQQRIEGDDDVVQLFNYDKYRPENCITPAQTFLIYKYLYYEWEWSKFNNNNTNVAPKSLCTKVEGRPGTGKSFVTNTLRNMTRMIHNTNHADIASVPTGAAASIINGATHCRSAFIPTG